MLKSIIVAARDRDRLAEVTGVVARFGLESLLARIGLATGDTGEVPADLPARARQAIEALGPTYVKLGQILATRRDLMPDSWIAEFARLHSDAPTVPFEALRSDVAAALGEPPETAFASFDVQPLAAASIAQVHRATLHDGRAVVVKIRRPGIRRRMEADLRLLRHLVGIVEDNNAEARRFQPRALVDQLARDVLEELDFTQEGRNADLLRADLAGNDRIVIPQIHWRWTSDSVLVMDFIDGVPPRDAATLRAAGIDPRRIADLGAELVLDMVLVTGRFHGDPHPGNLLCLAGDRLALLDLGSIGYVSPRRQHEFLTFVLSLRSSDPAGVADMLALWSQQSAVPRERILRVADRLVARHGTGRLDLNGMVGDFFPLLRSEGLVLPPDLLLIFKAMVTMDGVLAAIEPGFDLSGALQKVRGKLVAARIGRLGGQDRAEALLLELSQVMSEAPHFLRTAAAWLERAPVVAASSDTGRAIRFAGVCIAAAIAFNALATLL